MAYLTVLWRIALSFSAGQIPDDHVATLIESTTMPRKVRKNLQETKEELARAHHENVAEYAKHNAKFVSCQK